MIEKFRMCAWSAMTWPRSLGVGPQALCEEIADLAGLRDAHREHRDRVGGAAERERGADRDDLRRQRAAQRLVEHPPAAVRDGAEHRRRDDDLRARPERGREVQAT